MFGGVFGDGKGKAREADVRKLLNTQPSHEEASPNVSLPKLPSTTMDDSGQVPEGPTRLRRDYVRMRSLFPDISLGSVRCF